MKKVRFLSLVLVGVLLLVGCTAQGAPIRVQGADVPPVLPANSSAAEAAFSRFAVELLRGAEEGENTLVSPLSVVIALSMTANGAAGETLDEFLDVLADGGELEELNANCAALMKDYTDLGGSTESNLANSLWLDEAMEAEPDFLQRCADTFRAGLYAADLDTRKAMEAINGWVKEQTREKISSILEKPLSEDARLVLANAVYLKNKWQREFDAADTAPGVFTGTDGEAYTLEYLSNGVRTERYLETERETGVVLPYDDGKLAFAAVMPREGTLSDYLAGWDAETLPALLNGAEETRLALRMPKFKAEWGGELAEILAEMGLEQAFTPGQADFSAMSTADRFVISSVLHKTCIEVNEKGTEAAAVTAVMVECCADSPVEDFVRLDLNRPFVYAIVDLERQIPLFLGTFVCPE